MDGTTSSVIPLANRTIVATHENSPDVASFPAPSTNELQAAAVPVPAKPKILGAAGGPQLVDMEEAQLVALNLQNSEAYMRHLQQIKRMERGEPTVAIASKEVRQVQARERVKERLLAQLANSKTQSK